ncbi:MAG: extracellular solute-binding protein [Thermomicrobiales bacterium]
MNGEEGVAALTQLFDEMKAYAPPGILGWDNPDASNAFLNGDVAVLEGWSSFILPSLDDPDASKVVGNWGVARYPENGTGNFVQHNFAIFNTSKNPQAAFDYIAYCTGPETASAVLNEYNNESPQDRLARTGDTGDATVSGSGGRRLRCGQAVHPGSPQWLELFIGLGEGAFGGDVRAKLTAGRSERCCQQVVGADRAGSAGLGIHGIARPDDRVRRPETNWSMALGVSRSNGCGPCLESPQPPLLSGRGGNRFEEHGTMTQR